MHGPICLFLDLLSSLISLFQMLQSQILISACSSGNQYLRNISQFTAWSLHYMIYFLRFYKKFFGYVYMALSRQTWKVLKLLCYSWWEIIDLQRWSRCLQRAETCFWHAITTSECRNTKTKVLLLTVTLSFYIQIPWKSFYSIDYKCNW